MTLIRLRHPSMCKGTHLIPLQKSKEPQLRTKRRPGESAYSVLNLSTSAKNQPPPSHAAQHDEQVQSTTSPHTFPNKQEH
jgi:hypothetical protein